MPSGAGWSKRCLKPCCHPYPQMIYSAWMNPRQGVETHLAAQTIPLVLSAWMNPRQGVETLSGCQQALVYLLSMDESPTGGRNRRNFLRSSASVSAWMNPRQGVETKNGSLLYAISSSAWMNPRQGVETPSTAFTVFASNLSMDESPTGGRNERTSPLLFLTIILIAPLEGAPGAIRHTVRVPCTLPPFLLRTFAIMALRSEGGGEDERQKRGT